MTENNKQAIHWLTITPMPYFDDLFDSLSKRKSPEINAYYIKKTQAGYPLVETSYAHTKNFLDTTNASLKIIKKLIQKKHDKWIIGGWNEPLYAILLTISAILGRNYWIFTDAPVVIGRSNNPLIKLIRTPLLNYWMKHATGIFGTGSMGVQQLVSLGSPKLKTINLPYPLDESRFSTITPPSDGKVKICCSGRLVIKDKRYDLAIRSFADCVKKNPTVNLELTIAGTGPDENLLRALADNLKISHQVNFIGWQDQSGLRNLYNSSSIYLHPTDFEPYGITVIEALYSGLFVIASDRVGSAIELVKENENGILFKAGDQDQLTDCLNEAILLSSRKKLDKNSIRSASLKWEMKNYIKHFDEILSVKS